jgi:hypothetical protein
MVHNKQKHKMIEISSDHSSRSWIDDWIFYINTVIAVLTTAIILKDRSQGSFSEWTLQNPSTALSLQPCMFTPKPFLEITYTIGCYRTTIIN